MLVTRFRKVGGAVGARLSVPDTTPDGARLAWLGVPETANAAEAYGWLWLARAPRLLLWLMWAGPWGWTDGRQTVLQANVSEGNTQRICTVARRKERSLMITRMQNESL